MDDFPTRIADFLENIAQRARSLTVDRAAGWIRWVAAGIIFVFLGLTMLVFLLVGLFRAVGELIGNELTYAVFGGLFVLVGLFLWSKRIPAEANEEPLP